MGSVTFSMNQSLISGAKSMWYKPKKVKLAINSQLLTVQILTNNIQVFILCLSYLTTTVLARLI